MMIIRLNISDMAVSCFGGENAAFTDVHTDVQKSFTNTAAQIKEALKSAGVGIPSANNNLFEKLSPCVSGDTQRQSDVGARHLSYIIMPHSTINWLVILPC